jgi:UDP-N-acetyl-D-glucosamine dehydrogenase
MGDGNPAEVSATRPLEAQLLDRIQQRSASVSVIGGGYVGLTTAVELARAGFPVTVIELDRAKVAALESGDNYVDHLPDQAVTEMVRAGRLQASAAYLPLASADVILICVPTPITASHTPDLSFVRAAGEQVRAHLRAGQLVILESTTYPGTTAEVLKPILERSGLAVGGDLWLAFSPERIDPGNQRPFASIPKIVGADDPASSRLAAAFLGTIVEQVVMVSSSAAAEMVKLYENVFRNINIAFANEVALLCDRMGLDIWEIIDAAATKPYGFMPFYPGPGPGGHCIPVDPIYLAWRAEQFDSPVRFIELATSINLSMPYHVRGKIAAALNERGKCLNGAHILLLGVAYKRDIGDVRESPALKLIALLRESQAVVSYHDPHVPTLKVEGELMESSPLDEDLLRGCDCVVIVTDHSDYDYQEIARHAPLIVDTRNALRDTRRAGVIRL